MVSYWNAVGLRFLFCLLIAGVTIACNPDPDSEDSESDESSGSGERDDETDSGDTVSGDADSGDTDKGDQAKVDSDDDSQGDDDVAKDDEGTGALRHAVFFSFKEESTPEDVQGVADAFASLPAKIDVITDFAWGTNNSPEEFDDGFTHCFLLTFKDKKGREIYIPHDAHKGDFADVLRPHMKDVFVFDYWGDPSQKDPAAALKHAVFFKFKEDADPAEIKKVEEAFAALPSKIEQIKAFEWGINNAEEYKEDGFTHCFMVTFENEAGRDAYIPHDAHKEFVTLVGPVVEAVRVLDFTAQK